MNTMQAGLGEFKNAGVPIWILNREQYLYYDLHRFRVSFLAPFVHAKSSLALFNPGSFGLIRLVLSKGVSHQDCAAMRETNVVFRSGEGCVEVWVG